MQSKTVAYILEFIENLEKELAFLKTRVQHAISADKIEHDSSILVKNAAYFREVEDSKEILLDAIIIEDAKLPAKPTKKEQCLEVH